MQSISNHSSQTMLGGKKQTKKYIQVYTVTANKVKGDKNSTALW